MFNLLPRIDKWQAVTSEPAGEQIIYAMNIKDNWLQWRKRRAIKRRDHVAYFRLVSKIAKLEALKMINEKLSR